LVSLAIGLPSGYLAFDVAFGHLIESLPSEMPSIDLLMTVSLYLSLSGYIVLLVCSMLTMVPRHAVDGAGFPRPDALARDGREVIVRKGSYEIRVAKFSAIRVYEEDGTFRCLPTSTGLWAIVLLSLGPQIVIFAFPFLLYINDRCWKSVSALTSEKKNARIETERGIDDLIRDSLLRTYVLATEAADIRRTSFHDHTLILVTISLVAWTALLVLSAPAIVDRGSPWWLSLGSLIIAALGITGFLILRRRSRERIAREDEWVAKLFSAIRGEEIAGSSIELLLDACLEVPRWLSLHRKGIWNREPGKTLLIFILLVAGSNGLMQYGSIWWGFVLLSIGLLAIGISIFLHMVIITGTETRDLASEWEDRMKEMCSLLEPARRI